MIEMGNNETTLDPRDGSNGLMCKQDFKFLTYTVHVVYHIMRIISTI